ncbi:cytochrome P450 714C2-like [Ziziphus jujuba]|uniref:Cytochrome P450 714C2-like n=1 Tax=Ziziphus jujuba TaxID=326968 RepID=A0ABM4AAN7_ZIZJJ|nr:cytochrome P450 714C2-like [Ziziphus jujuba]
MEEAFSIKSTSMFWVFIGCLLLMMTYIYYILGVKPEIIRSKFRKQGINGPLPSILLGNVPQIKQILSRTSANDHVKEKLSIDHSLSLFPYLKQWAKQFGRTFIFALGGTQILYVCDVILVKEFSIFKSLDLGKPAYLQKDRGPLLGKGLISTNGALWAHQRKTVSSHLYMYKIKDMVNLMVESANTLVNSWESKINQTDGVVDLPIHDYVRSFSSTVISKILFGSNYEEGNTIFPKHGALLKAMASPTILNGIPFSRFLPTKKNMEVWRLEKEINSIIIDIKNKHIGRPHHDENMLKVIMEGAKNAKLGPTAEDQYIVDNCKNLFLAGSEVPAVAAMWGLMLLALHPEWQACLRSEVQQVCGGGHNIIDANMLNKMKMMKMVIQEVLRLYPVVIFVSRQALEDVKVGEMLVPKGVNIWIWMLELHRDPALWGPDAHKFNPERFANGVSGACKCPHAYLPFGVGGRVRPGQSLAMVELKILFALIVSNFTLSVSPKYRHSPIYGLLCILNMV